MRVVIAMVELDKAADASDNRPMSHSNYPIDNRERQNSKPHLACSLP